MHSKKPRANFDRLYGGKCALGVSPGGWAQSSYALTAAVTERAACDPVWAGFSSGMEHLPAQSPGCLEVVRADRDSPVAVSGDTRSGSC